MTRAKHLAVLGSTGSIGQQTLDIVRAFPDRFRVIALAAGNNSDLFAQQVKEFKPHFVHLQDDGKLASMVGRGCEVLPPEAMANLPIVDMVVVAVSGKAGLVPTLAAVRAGKKVALANKESLVMAGEIITAEARQHSACLVPVDSEHSAIWQCLSGEPSSPSRLILTASGGPFRGWSKSRLAKVTPEQALNHPSWKMGKRITIDSATLMNKGLEVIEARWLFGMPLERIEVLVHPQSIVHSMVEFADGSVKAQLSCPDMRLPIQYALSYPDRLANPGLPKLDWSAFSNLSFEAPDTGTFPCLKMAIDAGKHGGAYPAVLCAADEAAVELFLSGKIRFTDIARLVEQVLSAHKSISNPTIDQILEIDAWARQEVTDFITKGGNSKLTSQRSKP